MGVRNAFFPTTREKLGCRYSNISRKVLRVLSNALNADRYIFTFKLTNVLGRRTYIIASCAVEKKGNCQLLSSPFQARTLINQFSTAG